MQSFISRRALLSSVRAQQAVAGIAPSALRGQHRSQCDTSGCGPRSAWLTNTFSAQGAKSGGTDNIRSSPPPPSPAVTKDGEESPAGRGPMRHFAGHAYTGLHKHVGMGSGLNPMSAGRVDNTKAPTLTSAAEEFLASREFDDQVSEELFYSGYVPPGVFSVKKSIMCDHSLEAPEIVARVEFLVRKANEMVAVFEAAAKGEPHVENRHMHPPTLTVDDINHVRYIAVVGARLMQDKTLTNQLIEDILALDPVNIDAIEARIEVCLSGPDEIRKLRPLLNRLRGFPRVDPKTGLVEENDVYDSCFSLLADILLTSMIEKVQAAGEGSCSVFFGKVVQTVAVELFPTTRRYQLPFGLDATKTDGTLSTTERLPAPNEFGLLIERLFDAMDEQLYHICTFSKREMKQAAPVLQAIVAMLKTFLSMEASRYVPFPETAGLMHLLRLQTALRLQRRDRECHVIGERLIRHYNKHREVIEALSTSAEEVEEEEAVSGLSTRQRRIRFAEGSYAMQYQNALFQHVHDEVLESPAAKQQKVVSLIEAYPTHNVPWKILAFSLYLQEKPEDAVIACRKAIELLPSDSTSVLFLGNLYLELKQHGLAEEIITNFKAMLEMDHLANEEDARHRSSQGDGADTSASRGLDDEAIASAKAEIGVHTLSLERNPELSGKESEVNKQVKALHDDFLLQMRRAHMYSARGLPPLLHTEMGGDDVAFKNATENPEFASREFEEETRVREQVYGLESRKEALKGIIAGSTARNISGSDRLASLDAIKKNKRTFRNMERRDN